MYKVLTSSYRKENRVRVGSALNCELLLTSS